jgi:general secretion pathway protein F
MSRSVSFAYKAVRRDGSREAGVIEAASRQEAVALLGSRGAFAIEVAMPTADRSRARVSPDDLALGLRALVTILASGIPLARALVILDDLLPEAWLAVLPEVRHRVEQGERLADALEASALPLPPEVIGILAAGEAGSGLVAAADGAATLLEQRAAARAALRTALAYPSMLALAGSASVALLVGVVLPRFASLLTEYGQRLPLTTTIVLTIGAAARVLFVPVLLALALLLAILPGWLARSNRMVRLHRLLLAIPGVGRIRSANATANAASTLAALLEAGVPLPVALGHAARATGDGAIEERLLRARRRIGTGERIFAALKSEDAFTPTAVRLVRIGEETGKLADMLAQAARIEAGQALQRLQRLTRRVEPVLILLFGGVVMVVAAALLQAMYGLRPMP